MTTDARYDLRPPTSAAEWRAYHDIRRTVLFEARGRFGVYDDAHPDETRAGHHPLLLYHDGRPVGAIRIDVAPPEAIFRLVAIIQAEQRAGHGRAMLARAESFARDHGCLTVRTHAAADAVGFYERCGFSRDGKPSERADHAEISAGSADVHAPTVSMARALDA